MKCNLLAFIVSNLLYLCVVEWLVNQLASISLRLFPNPVECDVDDARSVLFYITDSVSRLLLCTIIWSYV